MSHTAYCFLYPHVHRGAEPHQQLRVELSAERTRAGLRAVVLSLLILGLAARAVAERVGPSGHVLAVDRSAKAIAQLKHAAAELIAAGRLTRVRLRPKSLNWRQTRSAMT